MRKTAIVSTVILCTVALAVRALGANGSQPGPSGAGVPAAQPAAQQERPFVVPALQTVATRSLDTLRMGTPPVIDGDLTDWPVGGGIALDRETAFSFLGHISDHTDLSSVIRSGWDEHYLYFAIAVTDDLIVTDSSDLWQDDGIEIGLDGLYDKYAWGGDDHQYTVVADGRTSDRGQVAEGLLSAVQVRSGGYDVELAIPMSKLLPGVPISGTVMGFTAGLHDDDTGDAWDAYLIWEGTNTSSKPEEFGSLLFTERLEDRIAALESKIAQLENRTRELLEILSEFKQLNPQ